MALPCRKLARYEWGYAPVWAPPFTSPAIEVASAQSSEGFILGAKIHNLSGLACPVYHHRYQGSPASLSFCEGMFMEKVNYIHQNPVRAELVERATDYRWSSARFWQGG